MATGRKTVVVGQVIDPTTWGNPLWDQSVQQFASDADRTAQFPSAQRKPGALTWLDDVKRVEVWDGAAWKRVWPTGTWNYQTAATDANGIVQVVHGLGVVPKAAFVQFGNTSAGAPIVHQITARVPGASYTSTTFEVQFERQDTGGPFVSNPVDFAWLALP